MPSVFVTGATGYIGSRLVPALTSRGHRVIALVRAGSESKAPADCDVVVGDPFNRATFADAIAAGDTVVQLVGVAKPSPSKAQQFRDIDLRSALETIAAASSAKAGHFVYVSVAQPAPVMVAYQSARRQAEEALSATGLRRTILRPWYVLGPGHRWPYVLLPMYWVMEQLPSTRERAQRLGLVTIDQMIAALVHAIEHPPPDARIVSAFQIRMTTHS
ncbi:MAG TPA: NAD(P)H-binding protein [Vicinamibacterales bacterium]|nr:NAD(P)H-binding protein [Vicinamibacterales bacterium]